MTRTGGSVPGVSAIAPNPSSGCHGTPSLRTRNTSRGAPRKSATMRATGMPPRGSPRTTKLGRSAYSASAWARSRPASTRSRNTISRKLMHLRGQTGTRWLVDRTCLAIHVVHQQVLPQRVWRGEVRLAAAELGNLLDELHQAVIAGQHEGVDQDALALAAVDLFERAADHQRIQTEGIAVNSTVLKRQSAGLAVGDHDDLLHIFTFLVEQTLRQDQAFARIGVIRAHLHAGEFLDPQL